MNSASDHIQVEPQRSLALPGWRKWVALAAACVGGLGAAPAETGRPGPTDFSSFRIIAERNIFNANRSSRDRGSQESRRPNQVDSFTLVGILTYEKGPYAFFDGTSSDFRKVLQPDGAIAGYRLARITGKGVTLSTGTNTVDLQVGSQMRREDAGDWRLSAQRESFPTTASTAPVSSPTPPDAAATSDATTSSSSADTSDVLKRLMQQREQELK